MSKPTDLAQSLLDRAVVALVEKYITNAEPEGEGDWSEWIATATTVFDATFGPAWQENVGELYEYGYEVDGEVVDSYYLTADSALAVAHAIGGRAASRQVITFRLPWEILPAF